MKGNKSFYSPATAFVTIPEDPKESKGIKENAPVEPKTIKSEPVHRQQTTSVKDMQTVQTSVEPFNSIIPETSPKEGYYISSDGVQIEKKTKTLSFVLRPSTYDKLKILAKSKGIKMNALVNLILEAYIKNI